LILLFTKRES